MCDQRLSLLESFLEHNSARARFKAGEVTIVDLTDPFIDAAGACSLFEIITRLFIRAEVGTGKVLVVDEAHKVRLVEVMCERDSHSRVSF